MRESSDPVLMSSDYIPAVIEKGRDRIMAFCVRRRRPDAYLKFNLIILFSAAFARASRLSALTLLPVDKPQTGVSASAGLRRRLLALASAAIEYARWAGGIPLGAAG